jgi:AcrR family transcriptional regulator
LSTSAIPGLRERKKLKTKAAIQRAALRLFKKSGYDETTVEDIAAAAEISPSTFFNYFPSKEDVVIYDEYDPMMFSMIIDAPAGEKLSQTIRRVLDVFAQILESDTADILERSRLMLEVPELRARIWEELEKARDMFAGVIASRTGRQATEFEVRMVAMVLVTVAFEASVEWVRSDGKAGIKELFYRAIEALGLDSLLDSVGVSGSV